MAQYNMSAEVKKAAEITGKTEEAIAEKLGLQELNGKWIAWNRREEYSVNLYLQNAKEKAARRKAKEELAEKLANGTAIWRRISGEWLVQITGKKVEKGDIVKVEKRDGTTSDELIKSIVTQNSDGIFARV
mgnify:CR=1 FL=1